MKQSNPQSIPGSARVFVVCLLSFAILTTPIAAIAARRSVVSPTVKKRAQAAPGNVKAARENLSLNPSLPGPVAAPLLPIIVATMDDGLAAATAVVPGGTINYSVNIKNNGTLPADDATNVQFNNTVDTHTTLVPGSPVAAVSDRYNTIGNTQISVPDGTTDLLGNDFDPDTGNNAGMAVTAETKSSTQCTGGCSNNVTINLNGSFTYQPPVGFTGTDTFTYTANSSGALASETVTITVAGMIWYINNNAAVCTTIAANCGTLAKPFSDLPSFQAINNGVGNNPEAGDSIFLYESGTPYAGPVTLLANQKFIGQDATASLQTITGLPAPSGTDPFPAMNTGGNATTITGANVNGINLGSGNTLRGFTVGATGTGIKINGTSFGTLIVGNNTLPDVTLTGTGQALDLTTGTLSVIGGFVGVTTTSSAAQGIELTGVADSDGAGGNSFSFGSTTVSGSTTQGILIGTTTADLNFGTTAVGTAAAGSGGTNCISLQNNSAGTRTFGAVTLQNNTGAGNAAFASGAGGGNSTAGATTISGVVATGSGISIQSLATGTSAIFGATSVTQSSTAPMVNLGGVALGNVGVVTFASLSGSNANGPGLVAAENTGTITVTNASASNFSTTNGAAINVTKAALPLTPIDMDFGNLSAGGTNVNAVNFSLVSGTFTCTGGTLTATGPLFTITGGTVSTTHAGTITQGNNAAMVSVSGGHAGTVTFNGTLSATAGTGLQFDNADGIYIFSLGSGSTTLAGGDAGIDILNGSGGSFTFGPGAAPANFVITSPTGTAFNVDGTALTVTASVTYNGNITQNTAGQAMVNVKDHNTGTITFQNGTLNATNGTGLQFNNCDSTTSYNFTGTTTLNGGDAGVDILNGSNGNFTFASGTAITNPTGTSFNINGGTGNVTYNGTITDDVGLMVSVANTTAGTKSFTGAITDNNDGDGTEQGISLTTNTGATISFSGGVTIRTTTSNAFTATGGGVVNVSGTNNVQTTSGIGINWNGNTSTGFTFNNVTSTTGGAVSITGSLASDFTFNDVTSTTGTAVAVTTATGDFVFHAINANGAAKGIALNAATGTFTVNGTSTTDGTGGTIQNCTAKGAEFISSNNITLKNINFTNNGTSQTVSGASASCGGNLLAGNNLSCVSQIHLQTVTTVTLDNLNITSGDQMGINGNVVSAFSLANSTVSNNGNESLENGLTFQNLTGTSSISNTLIQDNFGGQIVVANIANSSTLTLGITGTRTNNAYPTKDTGTTMIGRTALAAAGEAGILFNTLNTSTGVNMTLNLTGVVLNFNYPANAVFLNMNSASGALGGTMTNCSVDRSGGGLIIQAQNGQGGTYNITNSEFYQSDLQSILYSGLNPFNGTLTGTVQGNIIGSAADAGSACTPAVANCRGIDVNQIGGTGSIQVKLGGTGGGQGNTIQQFGGIGIALVANGAGSLHANVQNNTIQNPFGLIARGIDTNIDTTNSEIPVENTFACINMTGNTVSGTYENPGPGQFAIHTRVRNNGTHRLPNYLGGANDDTAAANFIKANNPGAGGNVFSESPAVGPAYQGGAAACTTPLLLGVGGIESALNDKPQLADFAFPGFRESIGRCGEANQKYSLITDSIVNKTALSQPELDSITSAAIARWSASGLSPEQNAVMRELRFEVGDLAAAYLGEASGNRIVVDGDAQGKGWFVDSTPADDREFDSKASATRAYTNPLTSAAGRIDLLTAIEHEIGHKLGLDDSYLEKDRDNLMYGYLTVGERRSPAKGQASAARSSASATAHYLLLGSDDLKSELKGLKSGISGVKPDVGLNRTSVRAATNSAAPAPQPFAPCGPITPSHICVDIPSLPAASSVTIGFQVTVNNPPNLTLLTPNPRVENQGTVTADGGISVLTDDPTVGGASDKTATRIDLYGTTTTVLSSGSPSDEGNAVTFTATVAPNNLPFAPPGATIPTGTVQFLDGATPITCNEGSTSTQTLNGSSQATCTTSALTSAGSPHTINVNYSGDGNFDPSNGNTSQVINACTTNPVVTNTNNSGAGSLREALANACTAPNNNITFNIPIGDPGFSGGVYTITLASELVVAKNVNIVGPNSVTNTNPIVVSGNNATRVFNINSGKTATMRELRITGGNSVTVGGAIYSEGTLNLINSTVGGSTGLHGGGIYSSPTGTLNVVNSTLSGNTANSAGSCGGGIFNEGALTIINSTLSGNTAPLGGGGLCTFSGAATVINSTIANNTSTSNGGGIRADSSVTLRNTIVADSVTSVDITGFFDTTNGNNLIENPGIVVVGATNITGQDPVLGPLANNGGLTFTHALLATSPAVEAGSNAHLPVDTFDLDGNTNVAETLPVDQRGVGFPRTADSADPNTTQTVDIGAYESHPTVEDIADKTTAEDNAVPQFTFNLGDGTGALIQSVTAVSSNQPLVPDANILLGGAGSTRTLDIAPALNANSPADGTATITVTVTATNGRTAIDTFVVTVTEVNDNPVPTNDTVGNIDEDCATGCTAGKYVIPFATLLGNDTNKGAANENGQTVNITGVSSPTGGSVAINGTDVEFTPTADFSGAAGFTYTVTDNGTTNTAPDPKTGNATVSFNIAAINDPPSFTIAGNPAAVNEDAGGQTVNAFATSISSGPGESQILTFNITPNGTTGNLSFLSGPAIDSSTGNLTYTTNADTNGTATFDVTLSDNGSNVPPNSNTSGTQSFTITVNAVNDAPNFLLAGNPAAVDEDAGLQTVNGFANSFQPGPVTATDEGTQTLVGYTVTQTGGTLTFSAGPAIDTAGNLTYTPAANANGTATFDVVATDSGSGTAPNVNQSTASSFTITVNAINDAPSFTAGPNQAVNKNAGAQTVPNWATAISAGPPDETAGQTVSFTVSVTGTTGSLAFTTSPAVSPSGTLTYHVTNATSGTATVDVKAVDTGSGVAPNQNESAVQTFTITVSGANVAPVNTAPASVSLPQNTVYTFTGAAISVADVDAAETDNIISVALNATNGVMNLSGTAGLTVTGGSNGTAAMTIEGTIPNLNAALNNMTFTPTPGYTGAASIQMVSNDLGKTGTGGALSDDDTINITVTASLAMYINELLFNPPGADAPNEYIEIRGPANTTIPVGTYLVAIEGDAADNPGDVQTIINLSGLSFGSNGFLVLLQNGNTYTTDAGATVLTSTTAGFGGLPGAIFQADGGATDIEDASVTFMLIQTGAAPSLTDDIDVNDDGTTDGFVFAGWNVRDSISVVNGSANARAYGAISFAAGSGTGISGEILVGFVPSYVGRIGDSTGSTSADWVASGVLGGPAPNWTLGTAGETAPASFANKALNHIGASNFANLAPVNSVPAATQNVNEDFTLTFNAGNANLISISDPDAGGADVKVTLTATNGTMSLNGTAGLTFTPAGANNDGVNDTQMIFTGTIANINTALNGMTFTPTLDYFGGASIQIVTDDQGNTGAGGAKTDTDTVNINVNPINDPPSFVIPANAAAVNEDAGAQTVNGFASGMSQGPGESGQTPLTFNLSPGGTTGNISFASGPAIDPTTGNLTYTTNLDTNGTATFNVTLSDSGPTGVPNSNTSLAQQFTITVNAVNDAPSFLIPGNPPAANEDAGAQTVNSFATTFLPGPATATDENLQTLVGYTVTPTGTTGNLTFTGAPSISNAGTLTYTPTGDTSGTATFNVVATDSGSGVAPNFNQSAPVAFTITVNGQNDAPSLDNTGNMSLAAINEDVPNASNPGTLVSDVILSAGGDRITDVDAGAVEGIAVFAVSNANGAWQYSIDNGTNWTPFGAPDAVNSRLLAANANTRVRFIPNLNFNGSVDPGLTFRAWDQSSGTNGNTADTSVPGGITAFSTATETASITVNPDNDTPTTTGIPAVTVNEDAANTVLNLRLSFNDVEDGNDLAYTVQTNTNPSLFSSVSINNANDNLTLAYTANAFGSAQITIRGTDVGGLFVESTFTVTVNSSNDPPTFTKGPDQTTFQNSGPQTVANWATNMSTGPADESGQTLTSFNVTGNTNAALFSAGPAINATTGTLTYTGANNASGNATITITLSDNGGTANGGNDTSPSQSFVITITPCVNPATVINTNDAGVGSLREAITNVCAGGTINFDPALNGQTITLTSGELAINKSLTINGPGANLLTISGNNASRIFNIGATFTVGISGLTMSNGRVNAAFVEGGAIQNSGTLTITGSTISGNAVIGSGLSIGGGISNRSTGNLTLRDSTISGNSASGNTAGDSGGGIYNQGIATIINSTISGNSADLGGGLSMDPVGNASIINSTVSGNSASVAGGGVHASGTVNVRNTIVAGNTSPLSPDVRNAFVSQGNNLIGANDGSTGFTNGVNNDQVGTVASPLNALLAPLGNYGGPTQTHALLPGSPAIEAANNCVTDVAHCGDANIPQLTTDQRGAGFNRLVNTTVDIGAFESRGFTIALTSGNLQSAVFNTAFGAPLVATVTSGSGEPVNGGQVVFTAPGSGASATFTGGVTTITSAINAGGQASASATANATVGGPYIVTATGNGITGTGNFSLTNIKANQTINFGALPDKTFGDPDFIVSPTATSGLPVSLAASLNCTVTSPAPGTVHITGAGGCTITASQGGNDNFNPAPNQVRSFTTQRAATNTAVTSSVNPSDFGQSVTFTATVSSGAGTPTGNVQFKDGSANLGSPVALNAGGVAQFTTSALTAGTHAITVEYGITDNFLASTGTLAGGQVVKPQPSLSINDVSTTEGDAGTKVLNFTVTLSAASSLTVTTNYATANDTATSPSDYAAITSTVLTFNPGDTSKTVSVTINGDIGFEPNETFFVNLSSPANATISDNQGQGTIQNDDAQGGFINFSQPNYNVSESTGIVTVTVTRTNDVSQAANVDYATDDAGASVNCAALNTGLASQRCDYTSMFGTLRFAANETQKTVDIPINLDGYTEGPEVFTFNLSNATGGAVLSASTATVTISDSPSPTPNASDDTASFVRQLYHDFLNRDADAAGLAFWKNNIDKCNDPAQRQPGQTLAACIEVQRITTIAAFFLSIEFRQTGGLVRDFYVAALDRPATGNMPNFVEFMRDTQAIQKGVVVGQGNWQQLLDANRLVFMNEFVTRAEFVALYPTTDTPTQYVDKLYQHANVAGTQQERLDAIEYFAGAATAADTGARARALLMVTQAGDFQDREIRRAFVHMLYLGYLRRNPNDTPDNDFVGFNFWVNKLNQFNGDYLQAEMVKAFLSSLEYRKRFGP